MNSNVGIVNWTNRLHVSVKAYGFLYDALSMFNYKG